MIRFLIILTILTTLIQTANSQDHSHFESEIIHPDPSNFIHHPIDLILPEWGPTQGEFLRMVSYNTPAPKGSRIIDYDGIHGIIVKNIKRRIISLSKKQLRALYRETYLTDWEYSKVVQKANDSMTDYQMGQWWTRTWWESFPAYKGGAPQTEVYVVGSTHPFIEYWPLTIYNTGKIEIDELGKLDVNSRQFSNLEEIDSPKNNDWDETPSNKKPPKRILNVYVEPDREETIGNKNYKIKIKPSIRVRFSTSEMKFTGDFTLKVLMELYWHRIHYGDLEWTTKFKPDENNLISSVSFSFLSW